MVKDEKFQCPSERGGPEDFKNHPTFVSIDIFGGVIASQTWEHFFGTPCTYVATESLVCKLILKKQITFLTAH